MSVEQPTNVWRPLMTVDRYTKLLLTVIALELGWIAMNQSGVEVAAQRNEPTPVVIRGVEAAPGKEAFIPVAVVGSTVLRVEADRAARSRGVAAGEDRSRPSDSGGDRE